MPYVKRTGGVVTGVAETKQAGWPMEFLSEAHPDMVAYRNPPPKTDAEVDADMDAIMNNPEMKSIIEGIADFQAPGQPIDLRDAIKARGRNNMPRGHQ